MAMPTMTVLLTNIYFWITCTFVLLAILILLIIVLVLFRIFTHAFTELNAKFTGKPICIFCEDTRYATWKPIKPEANMVEDKDYGSFLINEQGSYIDRQTKNIYMFFDAGFASGANVKAYKMAHDMWKVFKDEGKLNEIRKALMQGKLDNTELEGLRESINFSHLRSLSNTILPHNITAKVEKMIQQRMQGANKINSGQIILIFVAVLGAIVIGAILLKMYGGK
jgi:hypothetical protein